MLGVIRRQYSDNSVHTQSFVTPTPKNKPLHHVLLATRARHPLNEPWLRVIIILGIAVLFSLTAAIIGCVTASYHVKRRKILREKIQHSDAVLPACDALQSPLTSSGASSSDRDLEFWAQLDTIMATDTFKGREWNAYKRETRSKQRRQARGVARTSQNIHLPVNVRQLKGKMRGLSTSLIRSITRSEPLPELAASPAVVKSDPCCQRQSSITADVSSGHMLASGECQSLPDLLAKSQQKSNENSTATESHQG